MKFFGDGLSERHKELSAVIRKPGKLEEAKRLFLDLHAKLHLSAVSGTGRNETDILLSDLTPDEYRAMPNAKDKTIAYGLWHIARIEDLTIGILVANGEQLFNDEWKKRLDASVTDTGNALLADEVTELSRRLNIESLTEYRNAVGRRTREIVNALSPEDMKRKVSPLGIDKIRNEGGVSEREDSVWLLDYWGSKDAAGLLLMPPTRHVIMHLNDCGKLKMMVRKKI